MEGLQQQLTPDLKSVETVRDLTPLLLIEMMATQSLVMDVATLAQKKQGGAAQAAQLPLLIHVQRYEEMASGSTA